MSELRERQKIVAYLRGMAHMSFKHKGMVGSIIAQALDSAATQVQANVHADADEVFPEHMPPRYTIARA